MNSHGKGYPSCVHSVASNEIRAASETFLQWADRSLETTLPSSKDDTFSLSEDTAVSPMSACPSEVCPEGAREAVDHRVPCLEETLEIIWTSDVQMCHQQKKLYPHEILQGDCSRLYGYPASVPSAHFRDHPHRFWMLLRL